VQDPTPALLDEMSPNAPEYIEWDGKIHRYKWMGDKRRNAWYIAHIDGSEAWAAWGNWKHPDARGSWSSRKGAGRLDPDTRERIRKAQQERRERDRQKKARADRRYGRLFAESEKADPQHPYLIRKAIGAYNLRQTGQRLLVPMRDPDSGSVVSVQAITLDGFKRFAKGGRARGLYCGLGKPSPGGRLIIAEGYATGATIHGITGSSVVVAFSAQNMPLVADSMRKRFPDASIVVAADNDRFTTGNPGLTYARKAAERVSGVVACPQFVDDDGKPTDFNDLAHIEGEESVRAQLEHPSDSPVPPDAEPAAEEPQRAPDDVAPGQPFRCLGYDGGVYYYLVRATGQLAALSASKHDGKHLLTLAPLEWWSGAFVPERGTGADWSAAADRMFRACERQGVFSPSRIHGRGCWQEPRGVVMHLGDRLRLPDGTMTTPQDYVSHHDRHIYQKQQILKGPAEIPATDQEAADVLDLFRSLRWEMDASGLLAAGWSVLAPVCGALAWRPHIWITGGKGSGKTTILDDVIRPLLADMVLFVQGFSTEAGVRQSLKSDALPVLFDEAERGKDDRIGRILELARQASAESHATVAKGSAGGDAVSFVLRSMFCLSSIGAGLQNSADKSRFAVLPLQSSEGFTAQQNAAQWGKLEKKIDTVMTPDVGRRIIARTVRDLPQIKANVNIFRRAAAEHLGTQRMGDQFGTLLAGAWSLTSSGLATEQQADAFVAGVEWSSFTEGAKERDEEHCLARIMEQTIPVDGQHTRETLSIAELVQVCHDRTGPGENVSERIADAALQRCGVRVLGTGVAVANQSEWLSRLMEHTMFASQWGTVLKRLPGAAPSRDKVRFGPGAGKRATVLPVGLVVGVE